MSKESYLTWLSKGGMFPSNIAFLKAEELDMQSEMLFEISESGRQQKTAPGVVDAISIRDFKSVREAHVQLNPLTVVLGRNSSGKSSLIQSLLLSVQHLTNRYSSDRKISLNQHLVRLGTFSQMHRHGAESTTTTVGIECRGGIAWSADMSMDDSSSKSRNAHLATSRGRYDSALANLTFELSEVRVPSVTYPVVFPGYLPARKHEIFSARYALRAKKNLDFVLESSQVGDNAEVDATFAYVLLRDPGIEQLSPLPLEEMDLLRVLAELLYDHAVSSTANTANTAKTVKIRGKDVVVSKSISSEMPINLPKVLNNLFSRVFSQIGTDNLESTIEAVNQAQDLDDDRFDQLAEFVHTFAFAFSIDDQLEQISSDERRSINAVKRAIAESSVPEIRQILFDSWRGKYFATEPPTVLVPVTLGGRFDEFKTINLELSAYRHLLAARLRNVYHVGPIRDPESPADPIADPLYVGSKGEHTVEVLQREASRRVLDPLTGKMMLFSKALEGVLKKLELADNAQIEERGRERPGISMTPFREQTDAGEHDDSSTELNAVGVGVSQVLPVVMQCLLAQPGESMVIVEQPELHLHPRLEQTLADFFLACVRSGRQILIETHSEYLVNRLRLRIAEDMSDEVASLVKVVFAEQRDGVTSYREPAIDQYGNTEFGESDQDWPEGFLDLTLDEARELLKAAKKRRIAQIEKTRSEIEEQSSQRRIAAQSEDLDDEDDDDDEEDF